MVPAAVCGSVRAAAVWLHGQEPLEAGEISLGCFTAHGNSSQSKA